MRKSMAAIKAEHLEKTGRELNHREAVHRFYAQEKTAAAPSPFWSAFEKRALDVSTPTAKPPAATPPPKPADDLSVEIAVPMG